MDDQINLTQKTQTEHYEQLNNDKILAYSDPQKPVKSKKPIIFIVIIFFLIILSIFSYAYFSTGSKRSNNSEQLSISPTVTLTPTTNTDTPTIVQSISSKPSPTTKKQVFPTATKTPTPTATPTPFDTQPPTSYFTSDPMYDYIDEFPRPDGKACFSLSPPQDNYYSPYDIEVRARFDGGNWTSYQKTAMFCENLLLGEHVVEVQSRDPSGNEENPPKRGIFHVCVDYC